MKKVYTLFFVLFICFSLHAQSSKVITEILDTTQVSLGQVCYLSAVQQGLVQEDASYTQCINALYQKGQIPVPSYEASLVPLANITFIFAQLWDIQGGLFYRIFHGAPRYAYKQLKADGILPENSDPGKIISGQELMNLYTSCSIKYGNMELSID